MNIIIKSILTSLIIFLSTSVYADSNSKKIEYLGLFTKENTSFVIGSGDDASEIKRTMTSCAKKQGLVSAIRTS